MNDLSQRRAGPQNSPSPASATELVGWQLDTGAVLLPDGVRFRVWAPDASQVEVEMYSPLARRMPMDADEGGVWSVFVPGVGAGLRYKYCLNRAASFPDPYSRGQPEGVHRPSEVIDPAAYGWRDQAWHRLGPLGRVIYECHVGAATREGTFRALGGQLDHLAALGVTAIEIMPVGEFPGRWNWGYDGVYPFAPTVNYGSVHELKRLVDAAHQRGLGVILDVVYNHLGPEGNYLRQYARDYFTQRYRTPWGEAMNYDGSSSAWVRKYVIDNACYWIHEYHFDGLRLDATSKIHDSSRPHILQQLTDAVRCSLPAGRQVVLIAETSENDERYLVPSHRGGLGFDAIWSDDFHHALRRYLAGDHEGHYQDYQGTLDEVARTIRQGFLFEGQWSRFANAPRGTPAREQPAWQFQFCVQNHD